MGQGLRRALLASGFVGRVEQSGRSGYGRQARVLGFAVSKRSPAWTSTSDRSLMIVSIAARKLS